MDEFSLLFTAIEGGIADEYSNKQLNTENETYSFGVGNTLLRRGYFDGAE